jgi:hypothetical protein
VSVRRATLAKSRRRSATGAIAAWLVMVAVVVAIGGYALHRPAGNWDLVAYVATVHQWRGLSGQELSDTTFRDVAAYLTPDMYAQLTGATGDPTDKNNAYRRTILDDPSALAEQIPFYSVKPLYPALMLVLGAVGIPLGLASVVISSVAYALFGLLVFAWLRRHLRPWPALLAAALIAVSPVFSALPKLSTPDAVSLMLVAAALFAFVELRKPGLAIAVLVVAELARPNNVLLALAVICACAVARPASGVRLPRLSAIAAGVGAVGLVMVVGRLSGYYGLPTQFYDAVVALLPHPALGAPTVPLMEVLRLYATRAVGLVDSPAPLFVLLAILALLLRIRKPLDVREDASSLVIVAAVVAAGAGWLTFPNEPERILVGSFLAIAAVLVTTVGDVSGRASAGYSDLSQVAAPAGP